MEIPLTRQLAVFCHGLRYAALPAAVIDRAKYRTLAGAVWKRDRVERVQGAVRRLEYEKSLRDFASIL